MTRHILRGSPSRVALLALALSACNQPAVRAPSDEVGQRIARIERGMLPGTRVQGRSYAPATIEERMRVHGVPALSIAVVNDGKIEWARAYGLADVESGRRATTDTRFQAASISKPVAALGALRLVQDGRLSLDEDVNQKLSSWKIPTNEFITQKPVTLRMLLSHSAGLTVHGFPGYAPGVDVPTVVQLLNGEKPANTAAVRADIVPGSRWRYSGGGVTVMQLLLTDVTGEAFPGLMRRLVLDPIGMTASTFEQPLPASLASSAATGYRSNGKAIAGRYHTYPEMAAAGLWTTPTDLARYIIDVQRSFTNGSGKVLSRDMTVAMLTRQVGSHGLGPGVDDAADSLRFGHGGANEGFRAMISGRATRGQGVAVMTNSDAGGSLIAEVAQAIAREYGWSGNTPRVLVPVALSSEGMREFAGRYVFPRASAPTTLVITMEDGRLMARQDDEAPFELIPTAANEFTPLAPAPLFRFVRDSTGGVTALVAGGARLARQPER